MGDDETFIHVIFTCSNFPAKEFLCLTSTKFFKLIWRFFSSDDSFFSRRALRTPWTGGYYYLIWVKSEAFHKYYRNYTTASDRQTWLSDVPDNKTTGVVTLEKRKMRRLISYYLPLSWVRNFSATNQERYFSFNWRKLFLPLFFDHLQKLKFIDTKYHLTYFFHNLKICWYSIK